MRTPRPTIPWIALAAALLVSASAPGQPARTEPPAGVEDDAVRPLRAPRLLPPADVAADVEVSAALLELTEALADPAWERREAAMQGLLAGAWDVRELCAMLSRPLSAEQRYRLLAILRRELDAPRGAVGISMQWQPPRDGEPAAVEITDLVPGLPAEELLRIGDHITRIDGRPLNFMNDLRVLVQTRRPGEEVVLTVRRARYDERGDLVIDDSGRLARETIELPLQLGSARLLLDPQTGRPTPGGSVEDARARESRLAAARYAPRPVVVDIRGGEESGLVPTTSREPVTDAEIEAHQLIRSLRRQKEQIEAGRLPLTRDLLLAWQRRLDRLDEMAARPTLPDRERELYRRLADRYAEVLDGIRP